MKKYYVVLAGFKPFEKSDIIWTALKQYNTIEEARENCSNVNEFGMTIRNYADYKIVERTVIDREVK